MRRRDEIASGRFGHEVRAATAWIPVAVGEVMKRGLCQRTPVVGGPLEGHGVVEALPACKASPGGDDSRVGRGRRRRYSAFMRVRWKIRDGAPFRIGVSHDRMDRQFGLRVLGNLR